MFNTKQLDRIEKKLDVQSVSISKLHDLFFPERKLDAKNIDKLVKALRKQLTPSGMIQGPKKRPYVKSGKYSKKLKK